MTVISSHFFFFLLAHHARRVAHGKVIWWCRTPSRNDYDKKDERQRCTAKYHSRVESSRHPQLLAKRTVHHQLSRSISLVATAYSIKKKTIESTHLRALTRKKWIQRKNNNNNNGKTQWLWGRLMIDTRTVRGLVSQHIYISILPNT